jgi:hypothetical protein
MKTKILIAFILLFIGLVYVVDWIIFSTQSENEKMPWEAFKIKYYKRFPEALQSLLLSYPVLTYFSMFFFGIAGLIFINEKSKVYFILGIFSFVMAGWQLFSLM